MAVCDYCHQEMERGVGCTVLQFEGEPERIPANPRDGVRECHDCRAPFGEMHHPGCDAELCPSCGGQSISCGCKKLGTAAKLKQSS